MPRISVIIVTYNSYGYIKDCLDSVFAQKSVDFEVIIIDNKSDDGTAKLIKDNYPRVNLIENDFNYGVCKARNRGITQAKGEFIFCLDPDAKLLGDFYPGLIKVMEDSGNTGAAGPKILRDDGFTIYSCGIRPDFLRRFHDIGSAKPDSDKFAFQKEVFGVSAAAALYRKDALESIKQGEEYFDGDFFYFFEDADISWRLQRKGWKAVYVPQSRCLHSAGRSRNKDAVSQYFAMRNRYWVMIKNESLVGVVKFPAVFLLYDFWRDMFMFLVNPRYFFKAAGQLVRFFPAMLKKRSAPQQ
jgi:GT2 family glycosyltransferase